jgi:predicted TPR repeat methyltransferase
MSKRSDFDKAYYDHFYGPALHKAADERDEERLVDFVCAYLKYLKQPVRRVVDVGCGFGVWRDAIARHFPKARYTGVEISEYLCERYGWKLGSVVDFASRRPFDLVVCKDTLQYLGHRECEAAIENLAQLCRGALYLGVMTKEDWEDVCDRRRTDSDVYMRSASWYRRILGQWFTNIGGGLFLSEASPAIPWTLETLE